MNKTIVSAAPTTGLSGADYERLLGKLFVVEPLGVEKGVKTQDYGEKDATRANVYVLTGKDKSEDFLDVLIFPKVLQGQMRGKVGSLVVGRLTQGEANRGQRPPWVLAEATPADLSKAAAFVSSRLVSSADEDKTDGGVPDDDDEDAY